MVQGRWDVTARVRAVLISMVGTTLAVVFATLLTTGSDMPTMFALVVVSLTLVPLVRLGHRLVDRTVGQTPALLLSMGDASPVWAARLTDLTHHPLRPRAPELA